jgi:AcrR family transcriptional regulator
MENERPGKGDQTRRRILDSAARILAATGTDDVSLTVIARDAGLKAGSVYFHFSSKDALVAEVRAVGIRHAVAHLERAVEVAGPSASARLRAAVRAHFDARLELNDYAAVVLRADPGASVSGYGRYERERRRYANCWLRLITEAQDAGCLPHGRDARLVRELCFGAMNADLRGKWSSADAADTLLALIGLT